MYESMGMLYALRQPISITRSGASLGRDPVSLTAHPPSSGPPGLILEKEIAVMWRPGLCPAQCRIAYSTQKHRDRWNSSVRVAQYLKWFHTLSANVIYKFPQHYHEKHKCIEINVLTRGAGAVCLWPVRWVLVEVCPCFTLSQYFTTYHWNITRYTVQYQQEWILPQPFSWSWSHKFGP